MKFGLLIFIAFFTLHCVEETSTPTPTSRPPAIVDKCSKSGNDVEFDNLEEIDSDNASDYRISGECDEDGSEINIFVEDYPLDKSPICNRGDWEITIDITGIINKKDRIKIAAGQSKSNLLCKTVDNFFICPEGYIGVPKLDDFARDDFCVMRYEAKVKSGTTLSSPRTRGLITALALTKGTLITRVNEEQAQKYCKENGIGYSLISNVEWQTIARHIESVEVNWSEGETDIQDGNRLSTGNTGGPQNSGDDDDVNDNRWSKDKRSHKLPNNEYIWDFAGNLAEVVDSSDVDADESYRGYVYEMPQELEEDFGPDRDYSSLDSRERSNAFGGLGYISTGRYAGTIIRGGSRRESGIFSADTTLDEDRASSRTDVGFRCVYRP